MYSCTTESKKICEAEMPPQLSELISPEVSEGSWEVIVSGERCTSSSEKQNSSRDQWFTCRSAKKWCVHLFPSKLVSSCLKSMCIPSAAFWWHGTIVPIPKSKANDPRVPLNYRGISLLSIPYKRFIPSLLVGDRSSSGWDFGRGLFLTRLSALWYTCVSLNGQKIWVSCVKNRMDSGLAEAV